MDKKSLFVIIVFIVFVILFFMYAQDIVAYIFKDVKMPPQYLIDMARSMN